MAQLDVSVVIPAFDAAATLGAQLDALAAQTFGGTWEVIVVDDGSTDETAAVAATRRPCVPGLRVLAGGRRRGGGAARNLGAGAARGRVLLHCDADDVVAPGWVAAMAEAAGPDHLLGGYVDGGRLNPSWVRRVRRPYPKDRLPLRLGYLPYATSANFGISASLLRQLGGWDEGYERGGDAELCWRAQLAGHGVVFVPDAVVHYRHRISTAAVVRQQFSWGQVDSQLHRDYRAAGFRRRPWWRVVGSAGLTVLTAPTLAAGPVARTRWLARAALLAGRVVGSARARCLFL